MLAGYSLPVASCGVDSITFDMFSRKRAEADKSEFANLSSAGALGVSNMLRSRDKSIAAMIASESTPHSSSRIVQLLPCPSDASFSISASMVPRLMCPWLKEICTTP